MSVLLRGTLLVCRPKFGRSLTIIGTVSNLGVLRLYFIFSMYVCVDRFVYALATCSTHKPIFRVTFIHIFYSIQTRHEYALRRFVIVSYIAIISYLSVH